MNEFLGKLTNLGYEIFGIIVPGFLCLLLLITLWWSLGDVPLALLGERFPALRYHAISAQPYTLFDALALLAFVYFLGHLLFWLSRRHGPYRENSLVRVLSCLTFRIPRPQSSFDQQLQPLLTASAVALGLPINSDTWRRFYPLAKIMLAERLTRSLVATYQNKYTLHRSITAGASLLWWLTTCSILFCYFAPALPDPRWVALGLCWVASLLLIWGFSNSFAYHWTMFGNVVVTEAYATLSGLVGKK